MSKKLALIETPQKDTLCFENLLFIIARYPYIRGFLTDLWLTQGDEEILDFLFGVELFDDPKYPC